MTHWFRSTPFSADHGREWTETWLYRPLGAPERTFDVKVKVGKPLDVFALKGVDLGEVQSYADFLARTAKRLYRNGADVQRLRACPVCNANIDGARRELQVFGEYYLRCSDCGHVFVAVRPEAEVFDRVFTDSETHSSTYVDHRALETRMTQIVSPKLDWCMDVFHAYTGRRVKTMLDVGTGGGHMLAGAARRGIAVEGFEKSKASRAFAQETFGLRLRDDDFLSAKCNPADVVTFWGLLEYVAQPRQFIAAAKHVLAPGGMLIVEVPRVDALGTLVQAMDQAVVARHMDPTTHVNGFTDGSLCTALVEEGFGPVAVWYYGMDAYETCVQIALKAGDSQLFGTMAPFIPVIQEALDRGRQCDDIVIAAVPLKQK